MKYLVILVLLAGFSLHADDEFVGPEKDAELSTYVNNSLPYINTLLNGEKKGECSEEKCRIYDGGILADSIKCYGVMGITGQVVGTCSAIAEYEDASIYQVTIHLGSREDYRNVIDVRMDIVHQD